MSRGFGPLGRLRGRGSGFRDGIRHPFMCTDPGAVRCLKRERRQICPACRRCSRWEAPSCAVPIRGASDQDALGMPNPPKFRGISTNIRNLASPHWRAGPTGERCLVSATSFFPEYNDEANPKSLKSPDGSPHPMAGKKMSCGSRSPSRPLFAFAGIWTAWEGPRGTKPIRSRATISSMVF